MPVCVCSIFSCTIRPSGKKENLGKRSSRTSSYVRTYVHTYISVPYTSFLSIVWIRLISDQRDRQTRKERETNRQTDRSQPVQSHITFYLPFAVTISKNWSRGWCIHTYMQACMHRWAGIVGEGVWRKRERRTQRDQQPCKVSNRIKNGIKKEPAKLGVGCT